MGCFDRWRKRHRQVIWGKFQIPHDLTNYHFYATGAAGSGKSSLLRILYRSVLPGVAHKHLDTRALFYDQKGEAYPDLAALGLQEETINTNPFDSRCWAWDMARDVETGGDAREVATIMVPPVEGQNKFFHDAAALMLTKAIHSFIRLKEQNVVKQWDLRDVLLACSNPDDLNVLASRTNLADVEPITELLDASKESKSVRMTLAVENSAYSVIAAAWNLARKQNRVFSLEDWVEGRGRQILLLGSSDKYPTALATINRLLIRRAQQLLLGYRKGNAKTGRRTWIFLDEFPSSGPSLTLNGFSPRGEVAAYVRCLDSSTSH